MINKFYNGKNCIIFGVNSFIGRVLCKHLIQNQVNLGLIDIESHKDEELEINLNSQNAIIYNYVKTGDKDSFINVIEETHKSLGDIDYLVCSYYFDDLRSRISPNELSLDRWDSLFQDWMLSYFLVLKVVVPLMIKKNKGRIIFFNTTSGYTGEGEGEGDIMLNGSIHENACSSGITGMMTSIAADIIPKGISLNGIAFEPDNKEQVNNIIWAVDLWLSGIAEYSCGQILRLY